MISVCSMRDEYNTLTSFCFAYTASNAPLGLLWACCDNSNEVRRIGTVSIVGLWRCLGSHSISCTLLLSQPGTTDGSGLRYGARYGEVVY
jgi:hypothetical protein